MARECKQSSIICLHEEDESTLARTSSRDSATRLLPRRSTFLRLEYCPSKLLILYMLTSPQAQQSTGQNSTDGTCVLFPECATPC